MAKFPSDALDGALFDSMHEQVRKDQAPANIMGRKIAEMYVHEYGLDGFVASMNDNGYLGRLPEKDQSPLPEKDHRPVLQEIKKTYKDIDTGELSRATTGFYEYMKESFEKKGIDLDSVPNAIRLMFNMRWLLISGPDKVPSQKIIKTKSILPQDPQVPSQ